MTTGSTLRAMASGSWRRKISRRLQSPRTLGDDVRRITRQLQRDAISVYAKYHARRRTPGRVYRVPGRHCRMWLPIASGRSVAERRFGVFEPETYDALGRVVRDGDTVIELGACYGEFTIRLSQLVGRVGRVFAFELFPPYFEIAHRNVALNDCRNVTLLNRAVGRAGAAPVQVDVTDANPYGALDQVSRLDYSSRSGAQAGNHRFNHSVESISLRDFVRQHELTPNLIFMDIEGCELEVLADVQPLLREGGARPVVFFEVHEAFYQQPGLTWLRQLFERSGYGCERIAGHWLCRPTGPALQTMSAPYAATS